MNQAEIRAPETWAELLEWREDYPSIIHKWHQVISRLIVHTKTRVDDELGELIVGFMFSSYMDISELMALTHKDSHHGAQYFLRALFERTVTLKYLSQNPKQLTAFKEYDAVDWDQILKGIHDLTGIISRESVPADLTQRAGEARAKNKQKKCPACNNQKPASWTTLNAKDMATSVGLGSLYFIGYLVPSKLMHPTFWGTRERITRTRSMYSTLNCLHHLMIETIIVHRRHFNGGQIITPVVRNAVLDFLSVWGFADTSFDDVLTRGEERQGKKIYWRPPIQSSFCGLKNYQDHR